MARYPVSLLRRGSLIKTDRDIISINEIKRAGMKDANQSGKTPRIVVVYCRNAVSSVAELLEGPYTAKGFSAFFAALPCSSKIESSHPLKILADGADGVLVVACPEGHCRCMVGNVRAEKRINYVRALLDKAGMGAERLTLERGEDLTEKDLLELAQRRLGPLKILGPNPMKSVKSNMKMKTHPARAVPLVNAGRRQSALRKKGK
jgi:coenzyme F420-reducing hydrogenase delta subunit